MNFRLTNRKKKRENEILEVGTHRGRGRWRIVLGTFLVVLSLGGAIYGGRFGWRWTLRKAFTENPRFTVNHVVVQDNVGLLLPAEIIKASGILMGQNLFSLDLSQIRRDLELVPIIERVEVRRELPDQLTLRVVERIPVLRFAVYFPTEHGGTRQVILCIDKTGHVIELPSLPPEHQAWYAKLPWITGLRATDVRVGKTIDSLPLFNALRLLSEWETSAVSSVFPLAQIDTSRPNQLALVSIQGSVAVVAPPDFGAQFRRLAAILADARAKQRVVRLVDLTVRQNIPATYRE